MHTTNNKFQFMMHKLHCLQNSQNSNTSFIAGHQYYFQPEINIFFFIPIQNNVKKTISLQDCKLLPKTSNYRCDIEEYYYKCLSIAKVLPFKKTKN